MDNIDVEYVRDLVENQKKTHEKVSSLLQETYGGERGLSARSIRGFCSANGIHKQNRLSSDEFEKCTREAVSQVGKDIKLKLPVSVRFINQIQA